MRNRRFKARPCFLIPWPTVPQNAGPAQRSAQNVQAMFILKSLRRFAQASDDDKQRARRNRKEPD
jgi:hypothetical protein